MIDLKVHKINILIDIAETICFSLVLYLSDKNFFFVMITKES